MTARTFSPARRGVLLAAGAVALVAGAGSAWWFRRPDSAAPAESAGLWALQSERPDGGTLPMAGFRGRPLLVNFWAPWCPPCVEELPMIDAFFGQHGANGWQVVGLAVDKPAAVQKFLGKTPVSFPVGILGLAGLSVVKELGNTAGGLPFTLVLDAAGHVVERKIGQITPVDLQRWATQIRVS
ncbi:TlpA disulfide reductase family protein [Pseudorhodoferax sp. Leaf274]|uniref:TlpA family protein disulfide reductase n=1 Tax=Pseudorhodoferax sp. Leaf274 TaxID=1736318 RepID=UPI000702F5BF|nr:TlpA disulfide reductase family protein [Pseudorhodoferax sp. Leaf274]KQP48682.1 redoxin [Pseudorhodoferax sp. Leaf274]